jgi:zinc protease
MMKKRPNKVIYILLVIGLPVLLLSFKSGNPNSDKLPLNPNVRYGVLENGLTYYVLKNQEPKDRASFYIIQNVGAILEEDNQNGLAHFLEHMAFNGTKHYPGKGILDYLESYGVTFGRNINAYTSTNETVYNLSDVPTQKQAVLDSALLVLHDWTQFISLNSEEIDKERGVIHEEWRTRHSGRMRVYLESRKLLYQGSKYATRDVIGDTNVIDHFDYQTIRDFYHNWYRTDLQSIAVVGDFDPDVMVAKIKEMFTDVVAVKDPKPRYYPEVPDNEKPIFGIVNDPEAASIQFNLNIKQKGIMPKDKNIDYFRYSLMVELYSSMIDSRISELLQKGTPPFISGTVVYYSDEPGLDVYRLIANLNEKNIEGGIEAIMTENERVLRYGFVESELERAKSNMLSAYEKAYNERTKQNNDDLVTEIQNNYLTNESFMGIEAEYKLVKQLLPSVAIGDINKLAPQWNTDKNRVFILSGPQKEGLVYPTKDAVFAIFDKVKAKSIEPYKDNVSDKPLISEKLQGGKIVSQKKLDAFDATEWTLSNGMRVVIKPTDFKDDEILIRAWSPGGASLYPVDEIPSVNMMVNFANAFGLGDYDAISLQKLLTGKVVSLSPSINELSEGFKGSSSKKDFETLLQLQYLMFEHPRFDEEAFNALKQRYIAYVANLGADVNKAFSDSVQLITSDYNKRSWLFNPAYVDAFNFETMKKAYNQRFVDASDFVIVLVGNINPDQIKPLIETYLGSIKSVNRKENWVDNHVGYPKKDTQKDFKLAMKTEKTSIYINLHGDLKYSLENLIYARVVEQLLDKKYTDIIREQEGGTYGVSVSASIDHYPQEEYSLSVRFDTDPLKAEKLKTIVYQQIENLYKTGVDSVDLEEARENLIKEKQENLRKNEYWTNSILRHYVDNLDVMSLSDFEKFVKTINIKDMENFARQILPKTGKVEVVMEPIPAQQN